MVELIAKNRNTGREVELSTDWMFDDRYGFFILEDKSEWDIRVKESDSLPCVSERFDDEKFIGNVCVSYRHDYGLVDKGTKELIEVEVKEVMRAIKNNAPYVR